MERAAVEVPLWVSHKRLLERQGPLGRAWLASGRRHDRPAFRNPPAASEGRSGGRAAPQGGSSHAAPLHRLHRRGVDVC